MEAPSAVGSKGAKLFASIVVLLSVVAILLGAAYFIGQYVFSISTDTEEEDDVESEVAMGSLLGAGMLFGGLACTYLYWQSPSTKPAEVTEVAEVQEVPVIPKQLGIGALSLFELKFNEGNLEQSNEYIKSEFDINKAEDVGIFEGKQIYDCCVSPNKVKEEFKELAVQFGPEDPNLPKLSLENCVQTNCTIKQRVSKGKHADSMEQLESITPCRRQNAGEVPNDQEVEVKGNWLDDSQVTLICPKKDTIKAIYKLIITLPPGSTVAYAFNAWNSHVTMKDNSFTIVKYPKMCERADAEKLVKDLREVFVD